MSWIIELALGNLPALLASLGALFGLGWFYRKGRIHSRAKSDKELQDALARTKELAKRARDAGDRTGDSDLRADDGNKRIE